MSGDGTATVQAEDADVEFYHSAIAKKWGLCLWDKDCAFGQFCKKHHCEVRQAAGPGAAPHESAAALAAASPPQPPGPPAC